MEEIETLKELFKLHIDPRNKKHKQADRDALVFYFDSIADKMYEIQSNKVRRLEIQLHEATERFDRLRKSLNETE